MAHTPGPWSVWTCRTVERPIRITDHLAIRPRGAGEPAGPSGPTFAFIPLGPDGRADLQNGNARLIAAAPELLAACQSAADVLVEAVRSGCDLPDFDPEEHVTVRLLRAAISKATGE